jgi:hypothetical protein
MNQSKIKIEYIIFSKNCCLKWSFFLKKIECLKQIFSSAADFEIISQQESKFPFLINIYFSSNQIPDSRLLNNSILDQLINQQH